MKYILLIVRWVCAIVKETTLLSESDAYSCPDAPPYIYQNFQTDLDKGINIIIIEKFL